MKPAINLSKETISLNGPLDSVQLWLYPSRKWLVQFEWYSYITGERTTTEFELIPETEPNFPPPIDLMISRTKSHFPPPIDLMIVREFYESIHLADAEYIYLTSEKHSKPCIMKAPMRMMRMEMLMMLSYDTDMTKYDKIEKEIIRSIQND